MQKSFKRLLTVAMVLAMLVSMMAVPTFAEDAHDHIEGAVACVNNTCYTDLATAIAAAEDGQTVELLQNVTLSEMLNVTKTLVLNGNGHTITGTDKKVFELRANATFKNVVITNATYAGRALDTRVGGITVNLENNTRLVTSGTSAQALTVGGNGEGGTVTVNIKNSSLSAMNGYGIITFNPVNLNITDSSASSGYGALYMRGVSSSKGSAGSVVNVVGSTLSSTNNHTGDGNHFGTLILETNGITVNIDAGSKLEAIATNECYQWAILLNTNYLDNSHSEDPDLDGTSIYGNKVTVNTEPVLTGDNAKLVGYLVRNDNTIIFTSSINKITNRLKAEGYDPTTVNESNGAYVVVYTQHEHAMTKHEAVPATCQKNGTAEHYTCDICQKYFFKLENGTYEECGVNDTITGATTHLKPTEIPAKAPTCTKDGNEHYFHCEACDANYIINEQGFAITIYDAAIIPSSGHKLTKVAAVAPTCTEDGAAEHYYCSVCKGVFTDAEGKIATTAEKLVFTATGHKAAMGVEGRLPTCTDDGHIEYVECSCGALFTDIECKNEITLADTIVTATGHKMTKTAAKAATCTTAGNTEYYTCSVCKGLFADAEGKTATTAEKVVVAATGHKLTKVEAVAPTYTAGGNIEHYACACGALFADAEGKTATTAEAVKLAQLIKIEETKAEVSADAVDTAIKEAETTGSITIDLVEVAESETTTPDSGSDSTTPDSGSDTTTKPAPVVSSAALPVASLEKVAEISEEATLTVNMTEVTVTIDAKAMAAVAEQSAAETVTLKVEKVETETLTEKQQAVIEDKEVAVVVSATMISNNTAISDFKGGSVTIALPFALPEGTEGSDFQVYYVADDGTMTAHDTEYKNGCLVFSTTHFSDYVVVNTAAPADPTVPNTGDTADLMMYSSILMIALTGLAVLLTNKKKFSF